MLGHFGMIPLYQNHMIPVRENSEVVIICPDQWIGLREILQENPYLMGKSIVSG